jgi:hypothetical protein
VIVSRREPVTTQHEVAGHSQLRETTQPSFKLNLGIFSTYSN